MLLTPNFFIFDRRVEAEKRKQEGAIAAFRELLQRSGLKPSSSWRKVSAKLQDEEAYEVSARPQGRYYVMTDVFVGCVARQGAACIVAAAGLGCLQSCRTMRHMGRGHQGGGVLFL
jgi:hypothetical protein